MDVWWGGLLPTPEDFNKDPRIEQMAELKRQLEAANRVVASLTPKSAQKGTTIAFTHAIKSNQLSRNPGKNKGKGPSRHHVMMRTPSAVPEVALG